MGPARSVRWRGVRWRGVAGKEGRTRSLNGCESFSKAIPTFRCPVWVGTQLCSGSTPQNATPSSERIGSE
eukprot:scaffold83327_cov61-Phaeocystis_antarctica.AAC.1